MMRAIYKYNFNLQDASIIKTHKLIRILEFGTQNPGHGSLCMWAIVDPETEPDCNIQHLKIFGTGHPLPDEAGNDMKLPYLGSVQDGQFVWHIFDAGRSERK